MVIRMIMIERRIRGGDVSEAKRVGPLIRKGTETPRPTLANVHVQVQSNDLQSWRGVQCDSNHSSSLVPPVRMCHNHHGYSLQSQLDLQQEIFSNFLFTDHWST